MTDEKQLNLLLQRLQDETPNCGGQYHFTKIELPLVGNLDENLKIYLQQYKQYKHPYVFVEKEQKEYYIPSKDLKNLVLTQVVDFKILLDEKLKYWSNHRTSLDRREQVTELYKPLESQFKQGLFEFMVENELVNIYTVSGLDTHYSFGRDHVNDDTLIEGKGGCFVLHFGWSS